MSGAPWVCRLHDHLHCVEPWACGQGNPNHPCRHTKNKEVLQRAIAKLEASDRSGYKTHLPAHEAGQILAALKKSAFK